MVCLRHNTSITRDCRWPVLRTPADQESMRCVSCTAIEQALPRTLVGVIDRVSNNKVSLLEGDVQPLYRQSGPPPRVPAEGKRGARGCSFVNRTTLSELFQECYGSSRPRVYNIRQVCIHTIYIYIYSTHRSMHRIYISAVFSSTTHPLPS